MTPQQPYFPPPSHGLTTIWRKESVLVMTKEALLPDRCIKCNAPAEGRKLKRKLSWHHPALYLLILAGLLVYVLLVMVLRKTATIDVGLCEAHAATRRRSITITWILGLSSVLSLVAAVQFEQGAFGLLSLGLLLATAIYGIVKLRIVIPKKIDEHFVWLNGVNASYLQEFPEWQGAK